MLRSPGYGKTGAAGGQGQKGDTGGTGSVGAQGATGAQGVKGDPGTPATTLLGTIVITESASVAITASTRRVTVSTPAAWGVAVGQDLAVFPVAEPAGYVLHDVVVTGPNAITVGVTAPLLVVGASYAITARVRRFS